MRTQVSVTPETEAGKYLTEVLDAHATREVLLILSGGSALSILHHIHTDSLGSHVTVCMADERYTHEIDGQNFTGLMQTSFYEHARESHVQFLDTTPKQHEPLHVFTLRIKDMLEAYITEHPNCYAIGVLGIGEDGHTAGIFPASENEFTTLYRGGEYYVSLTQTKAPYPFRSTITPTFIEEVLDEVILYAVGKNKCENILDYMYNRTFEPHEIPALIPASHPQSTLFTDCPTLVIP